MELERITFYAAPAEKKQFKELCKREGIPMVQVLRIMLLKQLKKGTVMKEFI
jgi:hypothetical protein